MSSSKEYRAANREKINASSKAWSEANPDKVIAIKKKYRDANQDKIRAAAKAYRDLNHDKCIEINRKWRKEHPDHDKIKTSIIYGIYRVSDRKIVYVGETLQTLKGRKRNHKHYVFTKNSQQPLHIAMREQGWDAFEFVVIDDTVDFNPRFTEDYFIQMLSPIYNAQSGNTTRQTRKQTV